MTTASKTLTNGILHENPVLVLMIGLCPALACSVSATNALAIGLATAFVLVCSNLFTAITKKWVSEKFFISVSIISIASIVTVTDYFMQMNFPDQSRELGIFIPLITVNCIVLGRAKIFAARNTVWLSFVDGLGVGAGFTFVIIILGVMREVLGAGTIFGQELGITDPPLLMILPAGAFISMGILTIIWKALFKSNGSQDETCFACGMEHICHPAGKEKCELGNQVKKI
jgi:electron transport complex protein RnfE